jgi:UDPglucose 6-dehydrogenase
VNESQKTKLLPKLNAYFNGRLEGKIIALWGLAFKPNTDDIREAPSLYNINALLEMGAKVKVYDPEAQLNVFNLVGDKIIYAKDQYDAVEGADALMIMTEWPVFRTPDFDLLAKKLNHKAIFDGRNLFETHEMKELGFHYESVGRSIVTSKEEINIEK